MLLAVVCPDEQLFGDPCDLDANNAAERNDGFLHIGEHSIADLDAVVLHNDLQPRSLECRRAVLLSDDIVSTYQRSTSIPAASFRTVGSDLLLFQMLVP